MQARQRGLSLVELMVGITVGLFVVAAASLVVATQLGDNRRLLLETQVHQDLRATADIITRELRRAGAEAMPVAPSAHVWSAPLGSSQSANAAVDFPDGVNEVRFTYVRSAGADALGFKLEKKVVGGVERGVIRTLLSNGGWQDLTDINALDVKTFRVEPVSVVTEALPCARACSADPMDTACWPTLSVRTYELELTAEAASDADVRRTIRSAVRVRNDRLAFDAAMPPNQACPL